MFLRARKKTSREVSLYEPIGTDREGNEINLLDIMEQEQVDVIDRMEVEDKLHSPLKRETPQTPHCSRQAPAG